nr:expressed protein [Hymenolepis microstoma]
MMTASIPSRILECPICYQRLNEPRTLPCDHIFCKNCITDWLEREQKCPLCLRPATIDQLIQSSYILNDILSNINYNAKCNECNNRPDSLNKCDHCSKDLCSLCEMRHFEKVKKGVCELRDELLSVHGPELDKQEEKIMLLMSAATEAKKNIIEQAMNAHKSLNEQISGLHLRSLETLKKMEDVSHPGLNAQIEEVETLIGRIRACISESATILAKKDLNALINLDDEINRLLRDINDFQENQKALDASQEDSPFKNLRINPVYKWIASVIEEAEMLRKTTSD